MPGVTLFLSDDLPQEHWRPLSEAFSQAYGETQVEVVNRPRFTNAIEVLAATAVVLYLGTQFFAGFAQEAGRDAYRASGRAIHSIAAALHHRFFGTSPEVPYILVSPQGVKTLRYSPAFSMVALTNSGVRVKLAIRGDVTEGDLAAAMDLFTQTFMDHHRGAPSLIDALPNDPLGGMHVLQFDPTSQTLSALTIDDFKG